jgi:hypothetical protein
MGLPWAARLRRGEARALGSGSRAQGELQPGLRPFGAKQRPELQRLFVCGNPHARLDQRHQGEA